MKYRYRYVIKIEHLGCLKGLCRIGCDCILSEVYLHN